MQRLPVVMDSRDYKQRVQFNVFRRIVESRKETRFQKRCTDADLTRQIRKESAAIILVRAFREMLIH